MSHDSEPKWSCSIFYFTDVLSLAEMKDSVREQRNLHVDVDQTLKPEPPE